MRHKSFAGLLGVAAMMLLHAQGSDACATLNDCALSAKGAVSLTGSVNIVDTRLVIAWQIGNDPLQELELIEPYEGPYADNRDFTKPDGTAWTLLVRELRAAFLFVPRNRLQTERLDFSKGATIAVTTTVRPDWWSTPGTAPSILGARRFIPPSQTLTEPLFSFGQDSPSGWFFNRRTHALGDTTQNVMYTVRPWDPVPRAHDWVAIYLTFQKDGKLRIDQLSLVDGVWMTALLEDGWPISNLGQADSSGNVSPVTYFDWKDFYVGVLPNSTPGGAYFGDLSVFERALTPQEIVAHHWSRTNLSNLAVDMQPCNTGLYLNGAPVATPCGTRSLTH